MMNTLTHLYKYSVRKGVLLLPLFVTPFVVFADPPKLTQPAPGVGLTLNDFILWLIEILQAVGTPLLVLAIIFSGYKLLTAGGNEEKISEAKVWILWTLVGAAIIISAQVIAATIQETASRF